MRVMQICNSFGAEIVIVYVNALLRESAPGHACMLPEA